VITTVPVRLVSVPPVFVLKAMLESSTVPPVPEVPIVPLMKRNELT